MTLILTALSPEHVVQVSDRRFVWRWPDGRIHKTEDGHIKAIITPSFACSYTGPAKLGNGDTAEWIATELSDRICDPDHAIVSLVAAVEKEVTKHGLSGQPLAIVCAGWIRSPPRKPMATIICNFDQGTGRPTFNFSVNRLYPNNWRLSTVIPCGQQLRKSELDGINDSVENLCKSGRANAREIAQLLAECVRSVARSSDRQAYVSEEVLVTSLPHDDRLSGLFVVGKLVDDYWSVTCIKAGDSRVELPGGPILVGDKGVIQALIPQSQLPDGSYSTGLKIIRLTNEGTISPIVITDPPIGEAWDWPGVKSGKPN